MPDLLPAPLMVSGCRPTSAQSSMAAISFVSLMREIRMAASEPRDVREGQRALVHMHPAKLGAGVEHRKDLAGIEPPVGIEGTFDALLLLQILLREHLAHQVSLLNANAMLSR